MNNNPNKTSSKKDFDFFYILIKNWKTILVTCSVFLLIGLLYFVIVPKTYIAKSYFSIALSSRVQTAYGGYQMKTQDPMNYLATLGLRKFKDSVITKIGVSNPDDYKIEIRENKVNIPPNSTEVFYSDKFELNVSGREYDRLVEVSDELIKTFLKQTDYEIQKDMYKFFIADLNISIESLTFDITSKRELIKSIEEIIESNSGASTGKQAINDLANSNILSNMVGGEKGLIISMLLNEEKGSEYYQRAVLSIEELQLKVLENNLNRKKLLLSKLNENGMDGDLSHIHNSPFSTSYLSLTPSEIQPDEGIKGYIRRCAVFFFFGFFLSATVILIRSYYSFKYHD